MSPALVAIVALFALWLLAELKTSRPDGTMVRVHPYRRIMAFIMRSRNESIVYFETTVPAQPLLDYLAVARERFGANLTHVAVAAANIGIAENPNMNRFVVGHRTYQRKGRFVTFSMKRKKLDKTAKLAVVKLPMKDGETFRQLTARINEQIDVERSDSTTYADKEFALFDAIPRPVLRVATHLFETLDYYNLLPAGFIEGDGLFTSCFVANLGSLQMAPGFHHLYEWGTCPLFVVVGAVEERVVARDGQAVVEQVLPLRIAFDERTDDGLTARHGVDTLLRVLTDPAHELGCLEEDGSDTRPMAC